MQVEGGFEGMRSYQHRCSFLFVMMGLVSEEKYIHGIVSLILTVLCLLTPVDRPALLVAAIVSAG